MWIYTIHWKAQIKVFRVITYFRPYFVNSFPSQGIVQCRNFPSLILSSSCHIKLFACYSFRNKRLILENGGIYHNAFAGISILSFPFEFFFHFEVSHTRHLLASINSFRYKSNHWDMHESFHTLYSMPVISSFPHT